MLFNILLHDTVITDYVTSDSDKYRFALNHFLYAPIREREYTYYEGFFIDANCFTEATSILAMLPPSYCQFFYLYKSVR